MPYKDPDRQREYARRWVARRRSTFFFEKECEWCHAREDLELHHRDPNKKENNAIWSWGDKRRFAEIAKCIILCRSCHQKAHSQARRVEAELRNPHGTFNRYKLGCHCQPCRDANAERQRQRKREAA